MSVVKDLDVLAADPRDVKLAGKIYLVPGDLPIPTMLRLERYSQRMAELAADTADDAGAAQEAQKEAVLSLYEEILALFQVYQPDLTEIPIQMPQLVGIVNRIYGDDEEAEDPENPTQPPAGKTKKSSKSRSRSAS